MNKNKQILGVGKKILSMDWLIIGKFIILKEYSRVL